MADLWTTVSSAVAPRRTIPRMTIDLASLVRLLEDDPRQRESLRRVLLGDQPDVAGALAQLAEAQLRTEQRLTTLTQRVDALTQRVDALTQRVDGLTASLDELTKDVGKLTAAQRGTEAVLKSILDVVGGMNDKLAKLDGESLERRYREKGQAYFQRLARRLHLLDGNALSALLDDTDLSPGDLQSLFLADAIFSGRSHEPGREPLHVVVEASVTIDRGDVRRARERADLLARVVGTPVLAVVAGEFAPHPVTVAAQDADVWQVTNGRVVAPADDLDDLPG